jgi:hypothetical protein
MKWPGISLHILVILALCYLAACSPGGPSSGKLNCSHGGEVCITLSTVQSFAAGDPVQLKITVTSSKDITDLNVVLHTGAEVSVDGPQTWENYLTYSSIDKGYAYWNFAIKAGQSLTFNRVLHFPLKEGYFYVSAEVVNLGRIITAVDSFYVVLTQDGGQVIRSGTPLPLLTPKITLQVFGPGTPTPTLYINPTNPWMATHVPSPVTSPFVPLVATSTPIPLPYPPPFFPTPYPYPYPYP